jgi:hypothetical protein
MIFAYLFEVKSIQAYLFKTGKLKDVIAASERLDSLVDDSKHSLLNQVLETCELFSDLHEDTAEGSESTIRFLRNKGGAFYAYSLTKEPLVQLRSAWTLLLQQLFPSLEFTDALTEAASLKTAIQLGHQKLAEDRNTPAIKFPIATAIHERCARTGSASVPISSLANRAVHTEDKEQELDIDTELHRQAYQALDMRTNAALQEKFTPDGLKGHIAYPINLEKDFQFSASGYTEKNKEAIKDIAIIHIDGNGLGLILRELQQTLSSKAVSNDEYRLSFRQFSSALSTATQIAAQRATQWLYDNASYTYKAEGDTKERAYIPMRPIVLGGDDITLLCRADLALEYSKHFCREFKKASELALKPLYDKYLTSSANLKPYLTASGGILYHKAGHPFTHSHSIVEELCTKAKTLTKKVDPNIGPAALSFFRLSNATTSNIEQLIRQSQCYSLRENDTNTEINLGFNSYLVEKDDSSNETCFSDLENCIKISNDKQLKAPISMTKWRQMATQLSMSNKPEADRIYKRAVDICSSTQAEKLQSDALKVLSKNADSFHQWYWTNSGKLQSVIADLLVIDHFAPVTKTDQSAKSEES